MSQLLNLITRISLSTICASIAGMLAIAFIYCLWGLGEDVYCEFKDCTLKEITTNYD